MDALLTKSFKLSTSAVFSSRLPGAHCGGAFLSDQWKSARSPIMRV